MDTLIECLNLNKGSAGQGLPSLEEPRAVRTVYLAGERRKHMSARVKLLRGWERNGRRVAPFVLKMPWGER